MVEPLIIFFIGLCMGSFANVVIYRLPAGKSVVFPGSACPKCSARVRWYDNMPVISWILLMGKCRQCRASISWRYPLVELITGALFLAVFLEHQWSWTTLELLIFVFGLVVVSFIDFDHYILPDVFTLSGIVLGLCGAFLNPDRHLSDALLGVIVGGGFLWLIAYMYWLLRRQEGMGGGDIKLLAWIGAVLGVSSIPFVVMVASLVGSVIGIAIALRSPKGMKASLPFGPYLALGAVSYIFWGHHLVFQLAV